MTLAILHCKTIWLSCCCKSSYVSRWREYLLLLHFLSRTHYTANGTALHFSQHW